MDAAWTGDYPAADSDRRAWACHADTIFQCNDRAQAWTARDAFGAGIGRLLGTRCIPYAASCYQNVRRCRRSWRHYSDVCVHTRIWSGGRVCRSVYGGVRVLQRRL